MKRDYEKLKLEFIEMEQADVICTSGVDPSVLREGDKYIGELPGIGF